MTHHSSYRYGPALSEPPSTGRSSEVRVSYFDPVTGEPCATKPKPLDKKAEPKKSAYEKYAQRRAAEDEAAEIVRNMKERHANEARERHRARYRRPVLVEGKLYESVTAAAKAVGTTPQHLGTTLNSGKRALKGKSIAFAEVVK